MFSMGYRRAQSTQGNANFQKRISFKFGKQLRDHYPRALSERGQKYTMACGFLEEHALAKRRFPELRRLRFPKQSVRTLQKMALLRCCGREAFVHKWRTRKKEKAVCTTCQIVTLREKLKVITVLKDVFYVFISLGVVYLVFLDAVSRTYGKKHEEVDRH